MKKWILEFTKRGLMAAGGGPVILGIIYSILGCTGVISTLTPGEVCLGILTVTLMVFICGGISVVYQMERLPLAAATLIHGVVLYADYILIYLVNGWLESQLLSLLIFTAIFIAGYAGIWLSIYFSIKANTKMINRKLKSCQ